MLKTLLTLALASTTAADYGGDNQYDWQTYGSEGYKAETTSSNTNGAAAPTWGEMSMIPMRCVTVNGQDSILWSFYYDNGRNCKYQQQAIMTTPVPEFVQMWVEDKKQRKEVAINAGFYEEDEYYEEVELNEDYFSCTYGQDMYGNQAFYQLGCSKQSIYRTDMIPYSTNACNAFYEDSAASALYNGYEYSSGIDMSAYQIDFEEGCVSCIDSNQYDEDADADEADESSICELLWSSSMFCDELCAELGLAASNNTWEKMEIAVLLIELVAFFAIMAGIGSKRAKMPAKDRLIEEATVASMGLKRSHVFGLALGAVLMTACLASAGLVRPTMGFVAFLDFVGLIYYLKLTLFSSK